jgi:hypothetical protein
VLNRNELEGYFGRSKSWDFEEGLLRTISEWIGDGPMDTLNSLRGYWASETVSTFE